MGPILVTMLLLGTARAGDRAMRINNYEMNALSGRPVDDVPHWADPFQQKEGARSPRGRQGGKSFKSPRGGEGPASRRVVLHPDNLVTNTDKTATPKALAAKSFTGIQFSVDGALLGREHNHTLKGGSLAVFQTQTSARIAHQNACIITASQRRYRPLLNVDSDTPYVICFFSF